MAASASIDRLFFTQMNMHANTYLHACIHYHIHTWSGGGLLQRKISRVATALTHLDLTSELVELLEHGLGLQAHVLGLQAGKPANLPRVPRHLPLLGQLPDLLQVVQVLRGEGGWGTQGEGAGHTGRPSTHLHVP